MDKLKKILYGVNLVIALGGFVAIFLARSVIVLAAGSILVFIGLFLFLCMREKQSRTRVSL
ncbi:MAG TPA: hypothetical protein VMT62_11885 [Syntrophorhabdaceae bacterium]|nr:hypothetical protein [Syntrophorhabdaceae bacterium]